MRSPPHWKRHFWHVAFAVAMLLLAVAAWYMNTARQHQQQVYAERHAASLRLDSLRRQTAIAQARVALVEQSRGLLAHVDRAALRPGEWGERRLAMRQQRLSRADLEDLLRGLVRTPQRLFGAGAFDLSVTHADEGLFTVPAGSGNPIQVTIQGTQLFRTLEDRS